MENTQQLSAKFDMEKIQKKKNDMHYNLEAHTLSLRKKVNNKTKRFVLDNSLSNLTFLVIIIRYMKQFTFNHKIIRTKN